MAYVYMLQGASGKYSLGATENLEARMVRHNSGMVHSTKRLGLPLELVASSEYDSTTEALKIERMVKRWKKPSKALAFLQGGG